MATVFYIVWRDSFADNVDDMGNIRGTLKSIHAKRIEAVYACMLEQNTFVTGATEGVAYGSDIGEQEFVCWHYADGRFDLVDGAEFA